MKLTNDSLLTSWQHLPAALQTELAELLDQYACKLEAGDEPAAQRILDEHPELSAHLQGHLESLQLLCRATYRPAPDPRSDSDRQAEIGSGPSSRQRLKFLPDSHTPSMLGDYRIEREIGRGGMGIVYAATQLSLRRSVALKVLPFAAVLDQQQVARFRNEAQAAASLHHPHIVPVFAVGCERGVHYYSMQLIDGQTLEQVIKEMPQQSMGASASKQQRASVVNVANNTTLELARMDGAHSSFHSPTINAEPAATEASTQIQMVACASTAATIRNRNFVRATVELMVHVAEALDYAHQQGVVHRDIKPSNLLLDATGKVWVADFGLARCRGTNHLTAHGNVIGTALYMSPEQVAARSQEVDHRTDIYSFGITLYELLTLQRAYDETNREQLLKAIESREPVPPRRLNPAISVDLETIVFKAIAKQKSDRYATAGELAEDLRRYLDGRPTLARRPTTVDRAFKWAMRRQKSVCTAITLLMLSMVGMAAAMLLISQQSALKDQANLRAHLHLDQAYHVVDRFSGLLAERLEEIPGTEDLRAQMLQEAERYYLDFIRYAEPNPVLQSELSKVRYRLAAVYSRLGNLVDAEAQYQLAIDGFQTLPDRLRNEPACKANLALCFHNLAALRKQQGRYEAALADYHQAAKLQEPLVQAASSDLRFLREWASTQTNLATLMWARGDFAGAEARLTPTQQALEQQLLRSPEDQELRRQLVECRNSRVAVLLEQDPARAETLLRMNIAELTRSPNTADPADAPAELASLEPASQLAVARNNLASLLGQRGEVIEAIELMNASIKALTDVAAKGAIDSETRQQLAIAHNNLGQLYWSQGPNELAVSEFSRAESILRSELNVHPSQPDALNRLGGVLHNRSVVQQHQGDLDGAMQQVAQAIEFQALAIKKAPLNAIYRRTLETHRQQLDQVIEQLQTPASGDRRIMNTDSGSVMRQEKPPSHPVDRVKEQGDEHDAA